MVLTVTLLMTGFSVVAAVVLLFAYLLFLPQLRKSAVGRVACSVLLLSLAGLQLAHLDHVVYATDLFGSPLYVLLLLVTPPAFYFFSRDILLPERPLAAWQVVHLLPPPFAFLLAPTIAGPIAFTIGAAYTLWFARIVHGMRRHVRRFRFEMFFFGLFAVLGLVVLAMGLLLTYIEPATFYIVYANLVGLAFVLIVAALLVFPDILSDISEAASLSYANSTLTGVDVDDCLRRLDRLMREDKLYQNENLNLATLAEALELSSHQLSELINTRFGVGFSRFVREHRVAEAKRLLEQDHRSSVLAISLMTGFRSQSNFYAAFREITGEAPGTWRRNLQSG